MAWSKEMADTEKMKTCPTATILDGVTVGIVEYVTLDWV